MRAQEFIVEYRDKMFQYIKSVLPTWPDYVLRDWIYNLARGDHRTGPGYDPQNPNWKFNRDTILKMVADAGLSPNTQWSLNPRQQFTMDMWEPETRQRLIGRAGGSSDLGMGIPRDKERHATQAALAQQQGGVRKEPVIIIKTAKGYELAEGWHRTIQHFHMYPDGYIGPAYVAVAQGSQGVAEGSEQKYLWHGSRQKIPVLKPRQAVDTGGAAGSNKNAIYATTDPMFATLMGMPTPGSDFANFPNDPQAVLFSGKIRHGQNVYLHKLPFNGPDGRPQFVQGGNSREFYSIPDVTSIKPIEIVPVPVDQHLNLFRSPTPQDWALRKKYMKQSVAEGTYDSPTHSIKRRPLNVPLLMQKGAIFVTHPHGEQGWETGANVPDWQFSLITLMNIEQEPWCADAKKYLKPKAYNQAAKQINQISDGKYNQILWSIEKLGLGDEAFLDNVKENRMSGINVATAIQNTPPAWQQWISTLPQQLAQEFVDERPSPDATDIQEYTKLKLASPQPRVVNVSDLLKHPRNQYMIGLAPDDVVADINQKWGLQIASGKKYEPTPGRHRDTAKLSGATAAPSVMINGVITFGIGRFTAAALRGDRTMQVWDLRG